MSLLLLFNQPASGGGGSPLSRTVGTRVSSSSAIVTSGSMVIPDNSLVVLITKTMRDTADVSPLTITNSGAAATWTQQVVTPSQADQYSQRIWFHTAYFTTGGTFTFTATAASAPPGGFSALTLLPIVYQNASTMLGVSGSANNGPTDGAWTPSLSGAPASTSDVLAAYTATVSGAGNLYQTDGSGVTRLDTANAAGVYGGSVSVRTGSTAASYTWDDVLAPASTDSIYLNSVFAALEVQRATGGGSGVTGTLSASETGSDTLAASGTVTASGVTGTLSASETGSDTFVGSGQVIVQGTAAAAETGSDTLASAGTVLVQGTMSATETGSDTFAASGAGLTTGTLSATETGADTAAVAGVVVVTGSLSAAESGADTVAASGTVLVSGSVSATETGLDTLAASGTASTGAAIGNVAVQESGADTFVGVGVVVVQGQFAATETGSDTAAILQSAPAQESLINGGKPYKTTPWNWVPFNPVPARRPRKKRNAAILFLGS
jgi:hypothetical protein